MSDPRHPIRVSAVSYINSFPFIHGLRNHPVLKEVELSLDPPAKCAEKLISGQVDVGLIPVATIPLVKNANIFTPYCIGADGPVESVCLYAECAMDQIQKVLLDPESRTSVRLARILAKSHWNIQPEWVDSDPGFESEIKGKTAGVVIGDRAFKLNETDLKRWDLSQAWKQMTGLPFVFATWVSNRELPEQFVSAFNEALDNGLKNRSTAISEMLPSSLDPDPFQRYVDELIKYDLNAPLRQGMDKFLGMMNAVEIL
ncbi:MAG: chorismate dehydratase [Bacteroidia bacterium]|jgi:chorismate dehydratase